MIEKTTKYLTKLNIPIHFIGQDEPANFGDKLAHYDDTILDLVGLTEPILFRGTSFDRIPQICSHGTDGDNPTDGFWGSWGLDKALEYGPLILAYDFKKTTSSLKKLHREKDTEEIKKLRKLGLVEEYDSDSIHTYFSRIPDALRRPIVYERAYGYWIPDNQKDALKYIIALGSGEEWLEKLINYFEEHGLQLKELNK